MNIDIESLKDKVSYQSALLAVACGVAAALMLMVQSVTQPLIKLREAEDQQAILSEVLAGVSYSNDVFAEAQTAEINGSSYLIYEVKDSNQVVTHYVIQGSQEGYSGAIKFLVGVNRSDKSIQGMRVLSHTETPGLGDKIEAAKSNWVLSFNKRSLENTPIWGVKKDGGDFDQFSGATITPRAVVKGVYQALQALDFAYKGAENE